ncbi:sodium- and chloride-dependent glycine transporter 1-like [Watersipora subatra]|uniref:sodium- and chloride-dependent glycine transporter 1-like n=1 Tax=Watersipora subatra TaxID=2589382 RepID=UPI00355C187A
MSEKKVPEGDSGELSTDSTEEGQDRAAWGGQIEFILTCVGYAVGLGNVWRFPYLCYKNGGGAFLIPYVCMLALVGLPLFYMELSLGQFASLGPVAVWKFSPIWKGLGFASVMVSLLISIYYNVIIAICLFFFFKSMTSKLPWTDCNNAWNNITTCRTLQDLQDAKNLSLINPNETIYEGTITTPSEDFFYNEVLKLTSGMDVPGGMRWELVGCLALAWVIVAVVLIKGISSLGKVVYFTALFPYVLLTILLVRGALLPGSLGGIIYYLRPQWHLLADAKVWSDAAVQIFYSLGVASGGLIAMASYNKFNNNVLRDSLIVPVINCATSIYAGFVIFSILGYMAEIKDVGVDKVATQGPGLTFVVYPEALSTMPLPPLWSCLFFFMMVILGFSSEFSMMECVLTAFLDEYPQYLKTSRLREILFRTGSCFFCFLCGLPMVTEGGFYLLNLLDNYLGGFPLIIVGIGEFAAVNWVYGFRRFNEDIQLMTGRQAPYFFWVMWIVVSPLLMLGCLGFTAAQYKPLEFAGWSYTPPFSALGWMNVVFCVMFIPLLAIIKSVTLGGVVAASKPEADWQPAKPEDRIGSRYDDSMELSNEKRGAPFASTNQGYRSDEGGVALNYYKTDDI